jgi:hypothetical protein
LEILVPKADEFFGLLKRAAWNAGSGGLAFSIRVVTGVTA